MFRLPGACISLSLLALLTPTLEAEPRIVGPTSAKRDHIVELRVQVADKDGKLLADKDGKEVPLAKTSACKWHIVGKDANDKTLQADVRKYADKVLFVGPPGIYKVEVTVVDFDNKTFDEAEYTVTIWEPGPPVPPGPGPVPPGPTPPTPPVPPPSPSPIANPGYRVLILEDSKNRSVVPPAQLDVLFNKSVRDYLKAKCIKDAKNPDGAYRIWDANVDPTGDLDAATWGEAMKRPHASLPWLIISNAPKGGYEGPVPENASKTLELMKKYE